MPRYHSLSIGLLYLLSWGVRVTWIVFVSYMYFLSIDTILLFVYILAKNGTMGDTATELLNPDVTFRYQSGATISHVFIFNPPLNVMQIQVGKNDKGNLAILEIQIYSSDTNGIKFNIYMLNKTAK